MARKKKQRDPDASADPERTQGDSTDGSAEPRTPPTLEEQVLELTERCEDLNARALRAQADYQNLRRRAQQDLETSLQRNVQPLLEELLFVLDYLDMALASPAGNEETKNLVIGVQMTRTKFMQALENAGVKEIDTRGTFDPALHEATATRPPGETDPGSILETVRRGYTWQERVLRHAQVVVAEVADSGEDASAESEGAPAGQDAQGTTP